MQTGPSIGERKKGFVAAMGFAVALLFASLGAWQVQRANQQEAHRVQAQHAASLPPLDLTRVPMHEGDRFRRAVAVGEFLPVQYFIEGRREKGESGFDAIAILKTARGPVLVNRGFVTRATGTAPSGPVRVTGVLAASYLPPLRLGEPVGLVRPFMDVRAVGRELGIQLAPLVLHASPPPLPPLKRAMHVGYAVQWFVFAAVALVAAVAFWRR